MPVIGTSPTTPKPSTVLDIITNALLEIGVYSQGEPVSASDANFVLGKLNRMLDQWAARRLFVYAMTFGTPYTLVPGLQPHTIGLAGKGQAPTFSIGQRPVKIENANIILANVSPIVKQPLTPRDADWWANNRTPNVQGLPTDLYYQPDWPLGSLFLWPVPNVAYGLELETWTLLGAPWTLETTEGGQPSFFLPPGYEEAITLTLAERIQSSFGKTQALPLLSQQAREARAIIEGVNTMIPRMATRDYGMPRSGKTRSYFNWETGRVV